MNRVCWETFLLRKSDRLSAIWGLRGGISFTVVLSEAWVLTKAWYNVEKSFSNFKELRCNTAQIPFTVCWGNDGKLCCCGRNFSNTFWCMRWFFAAASKHWRQFIIVDTAPLSNVLNLVDLVLPDFESQPFSNQIFTRNLIWIPCDDSATTITCECL